MYYFIRFSMLLLPWIPKGVRKALAWLIGTIAYLCSSNGRQAAIDNMQHVFPELSKTSAGQRKIQRIVREIFRTNTRNYLELSTLPRLKKAEIERTVCMNTEPLDRAMQRGKGAILFTAHLGPFDYTAQYAACRGYQLTIPVENMADQRVLELMLQLRSSQGVRFIPIKGMTAMRTIIQELKQNHIILLATDRAIHGEPKERLFFNAPAQLPTGAIALAQKSGADLVGAFCWRTRQDTIYAPCISITADLTEEQRKDTALLEHRVNGLMEQYISEHPEQWVIFAPIWPHALIAEQS